MTYETLRAIQSRCEAASSEIAAAMLCAKISHNLALKQQMREHLAWAAEHARFVADNARTIFASMEQHPPSPSRLPPPLAGEGRGGGRTRVSISQTERQGD
jgi:hypothetical protein